MEEPRVQIEHCTKQSLLNAAIEFDLVAQALREARNGFHGDRQSQWSSKEEMRLQLARAGDVVLRLLETGLMPCPEEKTPWLEIASFGVISWKTESFVDPSSEGGEAMPVHSAFGFLETAVQQQERISYGDSIAVWNDAEANFVRRHVFLEAITTWLPELIGLGRSNLVLPRWHIKQCEKLRAPSISLVSDWLDHDRLLGQFSTAPVVASECARMCEALARSLEATVDSSQAASGQSAIDPRRTERDRIASEDRNGAPNDGAGRLSSGQVVSSTEPVPAPDLEDLLKHVRLRLPKRDVSERAINALRALGECSEEWILARSLASFGLSDDTVFSACANEEWVEGVEVRGLRTNQRSYARMKLIEFVTYRWQPKARTRTEENRQPDQGVDSA